MFNILPIIISLFLLISCSGENDSADTSSQSTANTQEVPPSPQIVPEKMLEPDNISEVDSLEDGSAEATNKEWDIIVNPNDSNNPEFLENDIPESDMDDNANSILSNDNSVISEENFDNLETQRNLEEKNSEQGNSEQKSSTSINDNPEISDKPTFQVNKNDIVLGNADAKVVFIEYYSPTCPHCAYYNQAILPQLKKLYIDTKQIAYVIREFIGNKQDLDAAILQRCPNTVDSFLKFQKILLDSQDKWSTTNKYRELLIDIGKNGGLSEEAYAKCLKDDQIIKILIANTNLANNSPNFMGTPAFFINGAAVTEGYSLKNLTTKIDKALSFGNSSK